MDELSKDADKLICVLYKEYLKRIKKGLTKRDAKMIGGSDYMQKALINKWKKDDVDDVCRELDRNGYVQCVYSNGSVDKLILLDNTIVYMESRFKTGMKKVLETIQLFKFW